MVSRRKTKNTTRKRRRITGGTQEADKALIQSVNAKNLVGVRAALDEGANVNVEPAAGYTPLYRASVNGSTEIVKELLDRGASVKFPPSPLNPETSPLFLVASYGYTPVLKLLIEKGVDVNVKHGAGGRSPLHDAALNGRLDIVKLLVENGADIHAEDKNGYTPIINAAQRRKAEVVDYLMQKGADPKKESRNGYGRMSAYKSASPELRKRIDDIIQRKTERKMAVEVGVKRDIPQYLPSVIAKYLGGRRTRKQKTNRK